jgi:hypothetical protein
MLLQNKYDLKKPRDFRVSEGHKYFKLVSNQTKIQKFLKLFSLQNILEKLESFLKRKKKKENK